MSPFPCADETFFWSDGSPYQYVNWLLWALQSNDPNDDCVAMVTEGRFQSEWGEEGCDNRHPFMCKMKQGNNPPPPSTHPPTHHHPPTRYDKVESIQNTVVWRLSFVGISHLVCVLLIVV